MNKTEKVNYLKRVQIASPCKADWDKMDGDERVRHCQLCNLNVFNISEMTTDEAVKLLQNKTGRLCIQLAPGLLFLCAMLCNDLLRRNRRTNATP